MNIAVVGTGYVGLVTGACLAEKGNNVTCVDVDEKKVARMQAGQVPIYEPGLEDVFRRNTEEGRLNFTTELAKVAEAEVIFLALPTPPGENGSADLSYIQKAATDIGPLLKKYSVIVDKSTVPVGTTKLVEKAVGQGAKVEFDVVSNPEFLREGQAVADFLHPERVVIGADSEKARDVMLKLYRPFVSGEGEQQQIICMDPASAEVTKYAANAFLATKISFMNELAALCSAVGADVGDVRLGIGTDSRIGKQFLYPGPGYGGSCFPKDTLALLETARQNNVGLSIVDATVEANERQKRVIPEMVLAYYGGNVGGKNFALWGLAFKDNTDDIRESPALVMIRELTAKGANVVAFDPQAIANVQRALPDNERLRYADDEYSVLEGADALIIATNWSEFSAPDFAKMKAVLKAPVIFDGRNMYDLKEIQEAGFYYASIGRRVVDGKNA